MTSSIISKFLTLTLLPIKNIKGESISYHSLEYRLICCIRYFSPIHINSYISGSRQFKYFIYVFSKELSQEIYINLIHCLAENGFYLIHLLYPFFFSAKFMALATSIPFLYLLSGINCRHFLIMSLYIEGTFSL